MLILIYGVPGTHLVPEQHLYSALFSPLLVPGRQNWRRQNHYYQLACLQELGHTPRRFLEHMNEKSHRHVLRRG